MSAVKLLINGLYGEHIGITAIIVENLLVVDLRQVDLIGHVAGGLLLKYHKRTEIEVCGNDVIVDHSHVHIDLRQRLAHPTIISIFSKLARKYKLFCPAHGNPASLLAVRNE